MSSVAPVAIDSKRGVIIPSYNSGLLLEQTVRQVIAHWRPVIVVVDGSTDGSADPVVALARTESGLHVLVSEANEGKGAAVASGMRFAADAGLTHAAVFDADGQHNAPDLPRFMKASREHPEAMILGLPVFGDDAPRLRVFGHHVANAFTAVETCAGGIGDALCGLRVYPVLPAIGVFRSVRGARGFGVETHLAVRLSWQGVPAINLPTPVRYVSRTAGGISHYRYLRDNAAMVRTHATLLAGAILRYPRLIARGVARHVRRVRGPEAPVDNG